MAGGVLGVMGDSVGGPKNPGHIPLTKCTPFTGI